MKPGFDKEKSEKYARIALLVRQSVACPQCAQRGELTLLIIDKDEDYRYLDCPKEHYASIEPLNWREPKNEEMETIII